MKRNIIILVLCGGLYWFNRLWLTGVTSGVLQWFLICYFNDILAGLVLPAVASILLLLAGRPALRRWWPTALLLLGAGLIWECIAPLWKEGAVFDWWDFAAYQLGGLLYLIFCNCIHRQKNPGNQ